MLGTENVPVGVQEWACGAKRGDFPLFQIQMSTNYEDFDSDINRSLRQETLRKLQRRVDEGKFNPWEHPIVVFRDGRSIKNGQHRFEICKRNGFPIYYIVVDEDRSATSVMEANDIQVRTTIGDCITIARKVGNQDVLDMDAAVDMFRGYVSADMVAALMFNFGVKTGVGVAFRQDAFKLRYKDQTFTLLYFIKELDIPGADASVQRLKWKPSFVKGLARVVREAWALGVSLEDVLDKINANPSRIKFYSGEVDCANMFRAIWNTGRNKKSDTWLKIQVRGM